MTARGGVTGWAALARGLYLTAIVIDLRRDRRARRESQQNIGGT